MEDFIPNAVLEDPRSVMEIDKDHVHENLYGGLPVTWVEKPQSTWKTFTPRDQSVSFSCVKQSSATALEMLTKNVTSAGTYNLRKNAPDGGMYLQDCGDIDYTKGTIMELAVPSQFMNDPQMDAINLPSSFGVQISGYRTFESLDIDKIAEAVQAYGQCIITFGSNSQEWQLTPAYLGTPVTFGHAICAIDFTLINGNKYLICADSAGKRTSPTGLRIISEIFLNKRGKDAMYYLGVKKATQQVPQTVWDQCVAFIKAWISLK